MKNQIWGISYLSSDGYEQDAEGNPIVHAARRPSYLTTEQINSIQPYHAIVFAEDTSKPEETWKMSVAVVVSTDYFVEEYENVHRIVVYPSHNTANTYVSLLKRMVKQNIDDIKRRIKIDID